MVGSSRTVLAMLVCSLLSACSASLPILQEARESLVDGDAHGSRTRIDGRVLDGRARGRYESDTPPDADAGVQIAAYQRDQAPPTSATRTSTPPALGMANRWRPALRSNDQDGDGVVDANDECPTTEAFVTVDRVGCGLFDAVLEDVVFNSGSRWLSDTARSRLDQLAETLLAFPESRVQVRAHTDSQGTASMNQRLSAERAESVVQYLQSRGVHARQLQAVGMGELQPLASNHSSAGRLRNRRVDIVTLPDQDAGELPDRAPRQTGRAVTLLAAASVHEHKPAPAATKVAARSAGKAAEPPLKAAGPVVARTRSNPPVMPLPQPGFAPGVSISGVVNGLGFATGSAELQNNSHGRLDDIARTLLENPEVRIVVMAHTDDSGDAGQNLQLSRQRAQTVVNYLTAQGVAQERLDAEGYGELLPLVQNVTEEDRATNRRVEIRIQRNQGAVAR
ncbi:OmpA family protein [Granulosicoccus sp. 3-233]|uniref:OmpA family protein n=1 Tax=Granulosicoccus sp. 3-233 TaxID=3417969 RepID=UPI003D33EC1F